MKTVMKTYPQINITHALEKFNEISATPLHECEALKMIECSAVSYSPTGLPKAEWGEIRNLCEMIENAAKSHGYPAEVSKNKKVDADKDIAVILHKHMDISCNEASKIDLWNYLACYALPHIAKWRWPEMHKERFFTERRHVFKRLWTRSETLYDEHHENPYWILYELGEDDCVQLLERPALSINHRLSLTIAKLFVEGKAKSGNRDLMRDVTKRLRRILPFTAFDVLPDDLIKEVLEGQFSKSLYALSATPDIQDISLLSSNDEVSRKSGLNWGQRSGRNSNQAYLAISAKVIRSGFFPDKGIHFKVETDDGETFTAVIAQGEGKALECPENNAWLGEYMRKRLNLKSGEKVRKDHLDMYGRDDINFFRREDGSYLMDFSVPSDEEF